MNDEMQQQLNRIYSNLRDLLTLKKRFRDNSVLVSIINIKSNEAYKFLTESGVKPATIPHTIFDRLQLDGLIRMAEKPDNYTITVKGVWEIESKAGTMSTDTLLERIDNKFFDLFGETGQLSDKEKIVLLAMIAVRSFSAQSALDLKKGETFLSHLQLLLESSAELLSRYGVIRKLGSQDLFGAQGNEHPVSNLIRHREALLKRTRGIYKTLGQQRYFLDLLDGDEIAEDRLVMLFGYIFGSKMSPGFKADLSKFCSKSAYEGSFYLFDLSVHRFANPIFDEQFNEALEKYYASKYRWEAEEHS